MDGKMKAILLAMFCLFGTAFACGGGDDMGSGMGGAPPQGEPGFGMGSGMQNVSTEARAQYMQATYEGDYDTAMELNEEYGLGGQAMESATKEMFTLMSQMFQAQKAGNWLEAVSLQDDLIDITKTAMEKAGESNRESAEECREAMNDSDVQELMADMKEAMDEGDNETVEEIQDEIAGLLPEGCTMMGGPQGMGGMQDGSPPEVSDECKEAIASDDAQELMEEMKTAREGGDDDSVKEIQEKLDEFLPEGCGMMGTGPQGGMQGMGGKPGEGMAPPEVSEE